MMKIIRKWRVQPVRQGMKAPYHFVYTDDKKLWQAEHNARKVVEKNCYLVKIGWDYLLTLKD